jgi:DNA polymerase IV
VTLKIRDGEFNTITRSARPEESTNLTQSLWECARGIFDQWAAGSFKPLRLLGVQATHLTADAEQLPLFTDAAAEQQRRVDQAVDRINARLGKRAVARGQGGLRRSSQEQDGQHEQQHQEEA